MRRRPFVPGDEYAFTGAAVLGGLAAAVVAILFLLG